ncbi:MAG: DUF4259 domain-containing protein [Rubripirellula sp.]
MGTWGLGTFDDDIACDWLEDLHESDPIAFFVQCLDLDGDDYLEFLACIGVVCTAEVIHAVICGPRKRVPEAVHQWIQHHPDLSVIALVPDAISGLRRVLGSDSEMLQRWEDNEPMFDDWIKSIEDLIQRLQSALVKKA